MSRARFATEAEVRANFDEALKAAVDIGQYPPTDQGFDSYTDKALESVAKAYPEIKPELISAAKVSLEGQFNGENSKRREAEFDEWLAKRHENR